MLQGDENSVYLMFIVVILSGPSLGALIGGILTTHIMGSYNNPKALPVSLGIYVIFSGLCIGCTFVNNSYTFMLLFWFAVFAQGFIEPLMMGIILNTVSPYERPAASSLSIMIETVFGYVPSPYLYGLV